MLKLVIPEMTCGHCVGVITHAVNEVDKHAEVDCDLQQHLVAITSVASPNEVRSAIEKAGYAISDELR
jgi:copper chaperone